MVTPREELKRLLHQLDGMTYGHNDDERADVLAAALRAAESSALERAAQAVENTDIVRRGALTYEPWDDAQGTLSNAVQAVRALIPPAAAPAAELRSAKWGTVATSAPAAETGKVQGAEALPSPHPPAGLSGYYREDVATLQKRSAEALDELAAVLRGKDGMGEKLARALGVPAGPLGRLVDAAIARIAELESDFRAYAEWATSEFGWRAWQPNETYDAWCARLAARAAPPEGEGK